MINLKTKMIIAAMESLQDAHSESAYRNLLNLLYVRFCVVLPGYKDTFTLAELDIDLNLICDETSKFISKLHLLKAITIVKSIPGGETYKATPEFKDLIKLLWDIEVVKIKQEEIKLQPKK